MTSLSLQWQLVRASYVITVTIPRGASSAPCNCHVSKVAITLARRDCQQATLLNP
ncbi:MAG: hypothetical protein ACFFD4_18805 [Candidatus Odinarchaeota archaeon]